MKDSNWVTPRAYTYTKYTRPVRDESRRGEWREREWKKSKKKSLDVVQFDCQFLVSRNSRLAASNKWELAVRSGQNEHFHVLTSKCFGLSHAECSDDATPQARKKNLSQKIKTSALRVVRNKLGASNLHSTIYFLVGTKNFFLFQKLLVSTQTV